MFSYELCEFSKNIFFTEHLRTTTSEINLSIFDIKENIFDVNISSKSSILQLFYQKEKKLFKFDNHKTNLLDQIFQR